MTKEMTVVDRANQAMDVVETKQKLTEMAIQSDRIAEVRDADSRQECHAAMMRLKDMRIRVEKRGLEVREDATKFAKAVIAAEKELIGLIEPEEKRLRKIRDDFDSIKQRELEAKAEAARKAAEAAEAARRAAEQAEADRIAREQAEALARERAALEADRAKLEAERAEQARIVAERERAERAQREAAEAAQREQLRKEREEHEAKLAEERQRLRAEQEALEKAQAEQRRAEQARLDAEAKAAREKADAEAKAAREAQAAREAEERARAQREAEEALAARMKALEDGAPPLRAAAIAARDFLAANGFADEDVTITLRFAIEKDASAKQRRAAA